MGAARKVAARSPTPRPEPETASTPPDAATPASPAVPLPTDLATTMGVLRRLLPSAGDLLPEDLAVLRRLWPSDTAFDAVRLRAQLERLRSLDLVRRVVVGREPHLVLGRRDDPAEPAATTEAPPSGTAAFARELSIDVETERVLLYRIAVVMELLAMFVLVRALLLTWLER